MNMDMDETRRQRRKHARPNQAVAMRAVWADPEKRANLVAGQRAAWARRRKALALLDAMEAAVTGGEGSGR